MSRRIALLLFLATEAVSALKPAPDGASCDPIGPRKDCGAAMRAASLSMLSVSTSCVKRMKLLCQCMILSDTHVPARNREEFPTASATDWLREMLSCPQRSLVRAAMTLYVSPGLFL